MDLLERDPKQSLRHPWETARVEAVERLLRRLPSQSRRVLDLGCGDAFLIGELQRRLGFAEALAYDLNLTQALSTELERPGVRFVHELDQLEPQSVDLVLLLDVLEHIEGPVAFLHELVRERLAVRGWVVITVPAFQALFSAHDRELLHYRRYRRSEIVEVAEQAGLEVVDAGYLFASLLLPRALHVLIERAAMRVSTRQRPIGVAGWDAPAWATKLLHLALCWDNRLCLAAHDRDLQIPGLSVWVICRNNPSWAASLVPAERVKHAPDENAGHQVV